MSLLAEGTVAPDFELHSDSGDTIKLSDFMGKRIVLFFYPRANTSGCTTEACGFRDDYRHFADQDVVILGISPDTVSAQSKFKQRHAFPYPLLADADHEVGSAYGVWAKKKMAGKEFMGVKRTTFVINEAGRIAKVFENVKPAGHSQEVLMAL